MKNNVKWFPNGEFEYGADEFNLEDVLLALKRLKLGGINKTRLRELLTRLVDKGLLDISEGKKQSKPQSKGTYKLTAEANTLLVQHAKFSI